MKTKKNYDLSNKAIGYVRVSSNEQKMTGYSVNDQIEEIMKFAEKHNIPIKEDNIVVDDGYSAGNLKRPGMQAILKALPSNQIKQIIVKNSSRMTREPINKFSLIKVFDKYNVNVKCIFGRWKAENEAEAIGDDIQVYIDAHQRKQVSPDTKRGMRKSADLGNYPFGGMVPRGYKRVPNAKLGKGSYLMPIEEYKEYIIYIFESLRDRKHSMLSLAKEYERNKVMGVHWTERHIEIIIDNPIYYGHLLKEGYDIRNHTIPIIDEQLFRAAHESTKLNKRTPKHFYIYGGLVYCQNCKQYCREESAYNKKGTLYKYHLCPCCKQRISDTKVDKQIASIIDFQSMSSDKQAVLTDLYAKSNRKLSRIKLYEKNYDEMLMNEKELLTKCRELKKEILELQREIKKVEDSHIERFIDLSYHEKRSIMLHQYKRIDVDFSESKRCYLIQADRPNPIKTQSFTNCTAT